MRLVVVTLVYTRSTDNWEAAWAEQLAKRQQQLVDRGEQQLVEGGQSMGTVKRQGNKPASGTHSIHRYIEIGLVIDRRFLDYYKNTDYEKYILTVMNMVSDFYHDSSSGNQIDVVVVRIIYLETQNDEVQILRGYIIFPKCNFIESLFCRNVMSLNLNFQMSISSCCWIVKLLKL